VPRWFPKVFPDGWRSCRRPPGYIPAPPQGLRPSKLLLDLSSRKATARTTIASSGNVVKAHFDVTKPTDDDVPRPRDLSMRLVGDDKLEYSNGEKFNLVSDENEICS
jgi:hypothetical protein